MVKSKESIGIYFLISLFLLSMGTASAADITVNNSTGPAADYTSIQAAVDAAEAGDTILVYSGSYTENVDVNRELTIISQSGNPEDTVVQALNMDDYVFNVTANNVTINGFKVCRSSSHGIRLYGVQHSNVSDNEVFGNNFGISLDSSSYNTLSNNNASSNYIEGIGLVYSDNNLLGNNLASGNFMDDIRLHNSDNNTLTGNSVKKSDVGITLGFSNNNTLSNNNGLENHDSTIHLYSSTNNTLSNNSASVGFTHIYLFNSRNNTLSNNTAKDIVDAIRLFNSDSNTLTGNIASASSGGFGFYLESSNTNILTGNIVSNTESPSTGDGIYLNNSIDNLIYNNYFNKTRNAYDNGKNIWNITKTEGTNIVGGPFLGGNYWSDYAGVDIDGDSLGDTLLLYDSTGQISDGGDYLPLLIPPGPIQAIPATVNIDPDVLNQKSKGKWITAFVELPGGYDVNDIELATVLLMGSIPAKSAPSKVGDYDADGIFDLMVKFDRKELILLLETGAVELKVTGELTDGSMFEGTDIIWVKN